MIRWAIRHSLYVCALFGGGAVAWSVTQPAAEGSGKSATELRPAGDVTEVVLSGTGDVVVTQGPAPRVTVTADDNLLPLLATETKGRRLHLRATAAIRPKTKIVYTVVLPRLEAVTVSGAGNVTVERRTDEALKVKLSGAGTATLRDVTYQTLALDLSGAGKATAAGSTTRATLKLSGAGKVDAAGLKVNAADVNISGAGQATVWAEAELKTRLSGAGTVKYKGSPNIEQKVSGAGRVQPLE